MDLAKDAPHASRVAELTREELPSLAPDVRLIGRMEGTAYRDQQWIVQRGDNFLQVTSLLYRIAELANGQRTLEEIAAATSASLDVDVSADNVRHLLENKLVPRGLVLWGHGPPEPTRAAGIVARSPLAVNMRMMVVGPRLIDPLTRVLRFLYVPPVLGLTLLAVAWGHWWLYSVHGLSGSVQAALHEPALLLMVFALILVSTAFHELGHAAALRYGGGRVRGMGVGLYLVYPAFYTDVTDSYRLGRWGRLRTDLGGFYFNLIFALGLMALYAVSGQEFLLLVVALINLEILYQCIPLVRLDGYWVLADLTGIPDFFSMMGAFLRSALPVPWWKGSKLPALRWWARAVFMLYVLVVVPILVLLLLLMLQAAPRVMVAAWGALSIQTALLSAAWAAGDLLGTSVAALRTLSLALPPLGLSVMIFNLGQTALRALRILGRSVRARIAGGIMAALAGVVLLSLLR